jgi:hypothetical protein
MGLRYKINDILSRTKLARYYTIDFGPKETTKEMSDEHEPKYLSAIKHVCEIPKECRLTNSSIDSALDRLNPLRSQLRCGDSQC